jgi:disulfide bond formation protein DsbB
MKLKFSFNQILFLLIFYSSFALIFAYISEIFFDYHPCALCIYQRYFFLAIIVILIFAIFFKSKKIKKFLFLISLFLLIGNLIVATYHSGVERHFFKGLSGCSSTNLDQAKDVDQLKKMLLDAKLSQCDQVSFVFLYLSMANWNMLFCFFLLTSSIILYFQREK